jgi:uroporphyrinogen III methyltransferase/synthase
LGVVYLVGAGPGDPELITAKGQRLLQTADVVVYDRLADARLLAQVRADAELVDAGKGRGEHRMGQEGINALLVQLGRDGKQVVRLKGGDPFLFGRGGEEAAALAEAGIPFEVVPGVTSALAVPAYAGIPVTERSISSSVAIVTGSEDPSKPDSRVDWRSLAGADTLVVLMGVETLPSIASALLEAGRRPETPVALVRWGTEPYQETVTGDLSNIVQRARDADLRPPAVIVVGDVVRLRDKLRWFDNRPLFGKRVLVTRTRQQAGSMARLLAQEGAWPVELPTIEIEALPDAEPMEQAIRRLEQGRYHWLVFTSANAVDILFRALWGLGLDARRLGGARVAAIGPATSEALRRWGVCADLVPGEYVAEGLVQAFRDQSEIRGQRFLLPRAQGARAVLVTGLEEQGAQAEELILYRAVVPPDSKERARSILEEGVDIATFTSSSTVHNLLELLDGDVTLLRDVIIACIGPVTAEAARQLGLNVDVTSCDYTVPGLVEALREHVTGPRTPTAIP